MSTMMDYDKKATVADIQDAETASLRTGVVAGAGAADYTGERPADPSKQLHRTFTARHIQMIGLAGSIGSGLFIGTGKASPLSSP